MFDTFGTNLGDVDETGEAVSEVDECAVWLQAFHSSFGNKTDFYVGNFLFAVLICFFTEKLAGGENQTVFFRESLDAGIKPRIPST